MKLFSKEEKETQAVKKATVEVDAEIGRAHV